MQAIRMILPALLIATTASFAQDVRYNFADKQDFAKYKTYRWVDVKGADHLDQIADQQLKTAIDAEMAKKGLTRTENDKSDLYLGYQVALGQEKQFTSYNSGWGYGPGWGGYYGGGGGMTTTTSSTIHTGQLGLDIYDAEEKQLVWRGTASKTIDPKAKPEKREKNLRKAVAKLLKNYPPPPKKG